MYGNNPTKSHLFQFSLNRSCVEYPDFSVQERIFLKDALDPAQNEKLNS